MMEEFNNITPVPIWDNTTFSPVTEEFICQRIVYHEINAGGTGIRIWDICLLIPALLFSLFLIIYCSTVVRRLHSTSSPIITTFYIMVWVVCIVMVIRAVVSMTVKAALPAGNIADKVLWLILRFFLLAMEMSVVVFGVGSAHLDSRSSVRRVILVTGTIAFSYSLIQCVLELVTPDSRFTISTRKYDIYGHGGAIFLIVSSLAFLFVYSTILVLPFTRLRWRLSLPTKSSFYVYCLCLAILYLVQAIGSLMFYFHIREGLCIIDVTTFLYFSGFDPFVFLIFLRGYFSRKSGMFAFLYRTHYDEPESSISTGPSGGSNGSGAGNEPFIFGADGVVRSASGDLVMDNSHMSGPPNPAIAARLYASTHFHSGRHIESEPWTESNAAYMASSGLNIDLDYDYYSGQVQHGGAQADIILPHSAQVNASEEEVMVHPAIQELRRDMSRSGKRVPKV